jgi:tripartite-type tricarboxylate transporter receptor subunit TctC
MRKITAAIALALALLGWGSAGHAQDDYPSQTIKLVVPYAAGGGTDTLARLMAQEISNNLRQTVIVDNRPGGSTFIGAEAVARAKPDGYTLLASAASTFAINPGLYKTMPYDPVGSFAPISLVGRFPLLLVVSKEFPARSVQELIALAKAKPGEINFASAGIGSTHHLAMELFKQRTGTDMTHVPYRGAGPAVQDLIGGRVPVMLLDLAVASAPLQSGLIRALGIATAKRFPELPDLPTISEAGVPDFEAAAWNGMFAPAGTPTAIIDKLNAAIAKALENPELKQKLNTLGILPETTTPAELAALIKTDTAKWGEVIRKGNVAISQQN